MLHQIARWSLALNYLLLTLPTYVWIRALWTTMQQQVAPGTAGGWEPAIGAGGPMLISTALGVVIAIGLLLLGLSSLSQASRANATPWSALTAATVVGAAFLAGAWFAQHHLAIIAGLSTLTLTGVSWLFFAVALALRKRATAPGIEDYYRRAADSRRIRTDSSQQRVVDRLEAMSQQFQGFRRRLKSLGWFARPPKGVYLFGKVERGKSFLMDGAHDALPTEHKRRYHLHQLLARLHPMLHAAPSGKRGMRQVAAALAPPGSAVFIDEFQLADLNTALLLDRLFEAWQRQRTVVNVTSNFAPDTAYAALPDAPRFRPCLARIERMMDTVELTGDEDYRALKLTARDIYQYPAGAATDRRFDTLFNRLAEGEVSTAAVTVISREIACERQATGIAWFSFSGLCNSPLSYADFDQLMQDYHTLMVSDVPLFDASMLDTARRFVWLVELAYDHRKRLLLSAAGPPRDLFAALQRDDHSGLDYGKVASRLDEMQSTEYDYVLSAH